MIPAPAASGAPVAPWCSAGARCSPWTTLDRPARRRRPGRRRPDRGGRPAARGARGHAGDRRLRRHRDARHDRHPPAHVADGDARLRRRLDAHPVLRLELPRARPEVPPARTSRPATGCRPSSRIDAGVTTSSTGRTTCTPSTTPRPPSTRCARCRAGSSSPTATSRPARGSGPPTRPSARSWSGSATPTNDMLGRADRLRRHRRPGVPGEGGVRGGPRPRHPGDHARRRLGRHQRRRHPADARERVHDTRRPSTCTPRR